MKLSTEIQVNPNPMNLNLGDSIGFLGSCFATEMADKCRRAKFNVLANPFGTIFNPISLAQNLTELIDNKPTNQFYNHNNSVHSINHAAAFHDSDETVLAAKLTAIVSQGHEFLKQTKLLVITLGTSFAYRLKTSNQLVGNCHKLPNQLFTKELLAKSDMVDALQLALLKLEQINPNVKIIITVSPVRHIKDGLVENSRSKGRLIDVAQTLVSRLTSVSYFPSYEIMMDELRDYRFYKDDLIHPSTLAIDLIWEKFATSIFSKTEFDQIQSIIKLLKVFDHNPVINNESAQQHKERLNKVVDKIAVMHPNLDLQPERLIIQQII